MVLLGVAHELEGVGWVDHFVVLALCAAGVGPVEEFDCVWVCDGEVGGANADEEAVLLVEVEEGCVQVVFELG